MNRNATITFRPAKKEMVKNNGAIVSYLNDSNNRLGAAYLHRIAHKSQPTQSQATVCWLHLPLDNTRHLFIKRSIDILLSVIAIIFLLSWLIPLLAILIKINSKGPIFFIQKRNKQNGAAFNCIKFRSMIVNADAHILPATANDKRITAVGRIMRQTFIDELPQFFNVLLGDMSVIGPRPHMISESIKFERAIQHYTYREKVKPGITGLSQVMGLVGAANTIQKMQDRTEIDIFYIRHWSLKLDLIILYRTIFKIAGK